MLEFSILLFVVLSIVWLMEMADVGPSIKNGYRGTGVAYCPR